MRLLVLSPQDSSEACLGVLVTGSTHQQALRCSLGDTHRRRPQETAAPQVHRNAGAPTSGTPRPMREHGQVPEAQGITFTEHLLHARPRLGRQGQSSPAPQTFPWGAASPESEPGASFPPLGLCTCCSLGLRCSPWKAPTDWVLHTLGSQRRLPPAPHHFTRGLFYFLTAFITSKTVSITCV